MKIIFSTAYDSDVLKDTHSSNTKYIGPLGLLNILERELGLYKIYKTDKDRISLYKDSLLKNVDNKFYSKSLTSDELIVAKQLLAYRDELILLGWTPESQNQPTRLKDLSLVENDFMAIKGYEGVSDRWWHMINNLSQDKIQEFSGFSLTVVDDINELPNYLQLVFKKMAALVSYKSAPSEIDQPATNLDYFKNQLYSSIFNPLEETKTKSFNEFEYDQSLQILNFKNEQLLVDCMAAYANENAIFINKENANFDYSLVSFGKSAAGSKQIQANPQIIQIIKLIIPCFSNHLNLQTLISFLTLSHSPLDFLLTQKLAKQLTRKPGVNNDEWNSIINCYIGNISEKEELTINDEKLLELFKTESESEAIIKERKKQVSLFLTYNTPGDKGVKKGKGILIYLKKWAKDKGKSQSLPELKEQFSYIEELCKNIIENFDFDNENTSKLEEMIRKFYESTNFTNYFKQENSVDVIDDISLIDQPAKKQVFWLDFSSGNTIKSNQFLLKTEVDYLAKNNCYNNPEKEINLQLKQWLHGIINCQNKLALCVVENTEKEKHPLYIRLESLFDKKSTVNLTHIIDAPTDFSNYFEIEVDLEPSKNITLPSAKDYLITDALKDIQKRETESASSIEKFIEYPFDWVMQYVAKFTNNVGLDLPDDNLLKGNVAHKTIELTIKKYPELDFKDTDIDSVFMTVIEEEAAIFLQPEKRFELSEFKYRFFKAFKNLVQIIKLNHFKIEALEYEFGIETPCIIDELLGNVSGYIDLYLTDSEGNPFIIDLKWSYSDKKYVKKIKENEAIQLAIYTAAIKEREFSNTAYFMLNQNKFITALEGLKGNNIVVIDSQINNQKVLYKIKKSLEFRWSEIGHGKLEMGDNFSLEGLQYHNEKGLIGLPEDKKVKKAYPYSGYKLFKGMLK